MGKRRLIFRVDEVLPHVDAALAATRRKARYGQTDPGPELWWVKDDGTYLMSNNPASPAKVAYAIGYSPDVVDVYERTRRQCGGDDFCEGIDLNDDTVAAIRAAPGGTLVIQFTTNSFTVEIIPKEPQP